MTLQSGLHLKEENLWGAHVYILDTPRVALAWGMGKYVLFQS